MNRHAETDSVLWCFRIKFVLEPGLSIESPQSELLVPDPDGGKEIRLRAGQNTQALKDASVVVLSGRPFDTKQQAEEAANRWLGWFQKAFAYLARGADFGGRGPTGGLSKYGREMLEGDLGQPVLNDVHGVSVHECDPAPRFVSIGAEGRVGTPPSRLLTAVAAAATAGAVMQGAERLAFDLYAASFFESSPEARLAMLMMAIETLIEPATRSEPVREHVEGLIAATRAAGLDRTEADSIVGSLQWLRDESISQAGRKLASQLGDRRYLNGSEPPARFFTKCYALRSRLFHGHDPRPTRDEVSDRARELAKFVGDLLSLDLREPG